jgi:LasA protease
VKKRSNRGRNALVGLFLWGFAAGCLRPAPSAQPWVLPTDGAGPTNQSVKSGTATLTPFTPARRTPGAPILSPTPDIPRVVPTRASNPQEYTVQAGDSLGKIAERYNISLEELINTNQLVNPDHLEVGQTLIIPVSTPQTPGSDFKIIPDAELVFSLTSASFDVTAFLTARDSYLIRVEDDVEGDTLSGPAIVMRVAQDYSVNPRLLLAVLEYQSSWVSRANPDSSTVDYPVGLIPTKKGLYKQLAWAADNLNYGYYLWKINAASSWVLADGSVVPVAATLNAGTAGVQHMFAMLDDKTSWDKAVSPQGLFAAYDSLFGYPFDYSLEPLIPDQLQQPPMQLPFEPDVAWSFTGGPHGGWGDGSGWAALDFAPPSEILGCYQSDTWEVAVAPGLIVRAEHGRVVEDLDGDGLEQTGWTVLYMHLEDRDRVQAGTYVKAGDRLGHPSCTGGFSTGTHLHLARRYNGEWIPADTQLPFNLDGWISSGTGNGYDGFLTRNGETIEAYDGRSPQNEIQR